MVAIQNAVTPREIGTATASANLFRALGGAVGVAVYGAVFTAGLRHWLPLELGGRAGRGISATGIQATPGRIHALAPSVQQGIAQAVGTPCVYPRQPGDDHGVARVGSEQRMRIAVLADVHGNAPALRAVLAEIDRDPVDAIVVAGDVVGGPLVDRRWRDELASWPISLAVDGVRFCHGSPRRDDEILTRATPDEVLLDALGGVAERLVVGGHTHQRMVRELAGGVTYANAGSVGIPYEGRPGAFWMLVDSGLAQPRATTYDLDAAVEELVASGFSDVVDQLGESLLHPVDPDSVTAFFEQSAGRGSRSAR